MKLLNILIIISLACLLHLVMAVDFQITIKFFITPEEDEEDILNFGVCPTSHPFAFNYGQKCCSGKGSLTQWTEQSCDGNAIYCDSSSCDDSWPCSHCPATLRIGCYSYGILRIENLSPFYDGEYYFNSNKEEYWHLEANRPIFQGINVAEGNCLWWHSLYRHWWIGPCQNIGTNNGFAYIAEDIGCPLLCETIKNGECRASNPMTWRRGDSNEVISNVKIYIDCGAAASAGGQEVIETTSSVGVNAVIQDNKRYKQSCRFVYRNGGFVCVKKNGAIQN